tara:strand:+ start:258 stop:404 length:147 start_codon:yes stop_codon:yes gene_type:complete
MLPFPERRIDDLFYKQNHLKKYGIEIGKVDLKKPGDYLYGYLRQTKRL